MAGRPNTGTIYHWSRLSPEEKRKVADAALDRTRRGDGKGRRIAPSLTADHIVRYYNGQCRLLPAEEELLDRWAINSALVVEAPPMRGQPPETAQAAMAKRTGGRPTAVVRWNPNAEDAGAAVLGGALGACLVAIGGVSALLMRPDLTWPMNVFLGGTFSMVGFLLAVAGLPMLQRRA